MSKHSFVMMVDNDQSVLRIITRVLDMESDASAVNTRDILARLQDSQPNLVILDIETPDLEESDVLQSLREGSSSPAIMLTARCEVMTLRDALTACSSRGEAGPPSTELAAGLLSRLKDVVPGSMALN